METRTDRFVGWACLLASAGLIAVLTVAWWS